MTMKNKRIRKIKQTRKFLKLVQVIETDKKKIR